MKKSLSSEAPPPPCGQRQKSEWDIVGKPFLKWVGGKRQLIPEIVKYMPQSYGHYFEPFIGGGALFFDQMPAQATLSDVNEELVNAYWQVQTNPDGLIACLQQHRYDKDYYYEIRNLDRDESHFAALDETARAARLLYLNRAGFNGMYRVNSKGQFNVPFGRYRDPNIVNEDVIRQAHEILQGVTIKTAPFDHVLDTARAGDFVYFDPPYLPLSQTAHFTKYAKDDFDFNDQKRLAKTCHILHERQVHFVLSNSYHEDIKKLYEDFSFVEIKARRSINSKADGRTPISEILICNQL